MRIVRHANLARRRMLNRIQVRTPDGALAGLGQIDAAIDAKAAQLVNALSALELSVQNMLSKFPAGTPEGDRVQLWLDDVRPIAGELVERLAQYPEMKAQIDRYAAAFGMESNLGWIGLAAKLLTRIVPWLVGGWAVSEAAGAVDSFTESDRTREKVAAGWVERGGNPAEVYQSWPDQKDLIDSVISAVSRLAIPAALIFGAIKILPGLLEPRGKRAESSV